jgi:peptidoglycan/LPS O-acetylase OafA/YrhL
VWIALQYRSEVDGLRALAVIPVILFHAGVPGFNGGYVGVDVFFVISGYLITSILLKDIEAGKFSIAGFYERRARRILPALFFVILCTIPFAWKWMPPTQLKDYSESLVATTFFFSNFLFWKEVGYFAAAAAEKPLLHTWSLAIEEQFYLFFPVLLWTFMIFGRRKSVLALGFIALVSFGVSTWAYAPDSATNFYLIHSRAWELLIGSLLVFLEEKKLHTDKFSQPWAQTLAGIGLTLIIVPVFVYSERTPNSGNYTLLPVVGTCLILAFATPATYIGRILSHRFIVSIGLVSYSAYLWHQPIFAFARLREINDPGGFLIGILIGLTTILAYLSWRYVERPFRDRNQICRKDIFKFTFIAAVIVGAIGLVGGMSNFRYMRFSNKEILALEPQSSTEYDCEWHTPLLAFPKIETCYFGAPTSGPPIILWGDSHADALLAAADEAFKRNSLVGWRVRNDYCHPIVGIYGSRKFSRDRVVQCEKSQTALMDFLKSFKPRATIIAIRWTFRLYPIEGKIDELGYDNGEGGVEKESYRTYFVPGPDGALLLDGVSKAEATKDFITSFGILGAPVIVQYPVPETGWNIPNLNFKYLVSTGEIPATISTSASRFEERNAFVRETLDSTIHDPDILAIKPSDLLCNSFVANRCIAQTHGVPLYFDDDHLSRNGAELIISKILEKLK